MSRIFKPIAVLLLLVVAGVGIALFEFLLHGGQFDTLHPHFAGRCESLEMGASASDLRIDRSHRIAYLSYLDRRAILEGKAEPGTVMLVDLDASSPRPRAADLNDPPGFRPDGLSLYAPAAGPQRLFVVSHRPIEPSGTEEAIEILEQSPSGGFRPIETLRDPLLVSADSIVAVGPREFYVTNRSGADGAIGRAVETIFRRGLATVLYYDGKTMRKVLTALASATGVAASADGQHLYVSEALRNRINVYRRDATSGALALERSVELPGAPARIDVDADGNLWVAAHPKRLALLRFLGDPRKPAPTEILRISPGEWTAVEEYLEPGAVLSAGSVAARLEKTLLVGSLAERKLLRCTLP